MCDFKALQSLRLVPRHLPLHKGGLIRPLARVVAEGAALIKTVGVGASTTRERATQAYIILQNRIALSVAYGDSSPGGRAFKLTARSVYSRRYGVIQACRDRRPRLSAIPKLQSKHVRNPQKPTTFFQKPNLCRIYSRQKAKKLRIFL